MQSVIIKVIVKTKMHSSLKFLLEKRYLKLGVEVKALCVFFSWYLIFDRNLFLRQKQAGNVSILNNYIASL